MSTMKNSVTLIGHLGSDVACHTLSTGRKVARVSLATNEFYTDKAGERVKRTDWHSITAWGTVAERMQNELSKGMSVMIEGKLVHRTYVDKEGRTRYVSEVVASGFLAQVTTQAVA